MDNQQARIIPSHTCLLVSDKVYLTLYGTLATQTSKKGNAVRTTSPRMIDSFLCISLQCRGKQFGNSMERLNACPQIQLPNDGNADAHVPWTRLVTSAIILGSTSTAITFFACSSSLTVMLPVPGPISSTCSMTIVFAANHRARL